MVYLLCPSIWQQVEVFYLIAGTTLKAVRLQRNDEICVSVNVAKAEKTGCMAYGEIKAQIMLCPKCCVMGNQQPRPEQGKVQRLSRKRVGSQAIGGSKW